MFQRRIPEDLRHAPTPGVRGFATLAAIEACARGVLTSVFPIAMYRALGNAETVSKVYLVIGFVSMMVALLAPWLTRHLPRRHMYPDDDGWESPLPAFRAVLDGGRARAKHNRGGCALGVLQRVCLGLCGTRFTWSL